MICLPNEPTQGAATPIGPLAPFIGKTMDELEREFLRETLAHTNGNREEAAAMLGISERTLYRKIKEGK